jgi:histidinol-phosphate aminotransferase
MATLEHQNKIRDRVSRLRSWTAELAEELQGLGVRTFPTETYFFLADFSPYSASKIAAELREREILVKPLDHDRLGSGYMRVTTARPEENERVVGALAEIL